MYGIKTEKGLLVIKKENIESLLIGQDSICLTTTSGKDYIVNQHCEHYKKWIKLYDRTSNPNIAYSI